MKIKLDENLPDRLCSALVSFGHEVDTVHQEGLAGCSDEHVWEAAQREGRFFLTQDLDFSDLRKYKLGTHHGVLLFRLESPTRLNLILRVHEIFGSEDVESWKGCFVVATEMKIRVRKLQEG